MQRISSVEALRGVVQGIQENGAMVEITVDLPEGGRFTAVITRSAAHSLRLEIGKPFFRSTTSYLKG